MSHLKVTEGCSSSRLGCICKLQILVSLGVSWDRKSLNLPIQVSLRAVYKETEKKYRHAMSF